ncbi:MAG: GDSL-type esterase/lipase family protein [Bacilli bacterium]|nr:GDSL-type esterase/lipase family protein [Bacilli bacterium]
MKENGIVINVLGDSITEAAYLPVEEGFCGLLEKELGYEVRNYGVGGTSIAPSISPNLENPQYDLDFLQRFDKMDHHADVLIVFGGTNDYGHGDAPFGTLDDNTPHTFLGSLRTLCEKIKKHYRNKPVIFITPMKRELNVRLKPMVSKGELSYKLENYANFISYFASIYGFDCIDLYHELDIDPSKAEDKEKYTKDGLHPNALGHSIIAKRILNKLSILSTSDLSLDWTFHYEKDGFRSQDFLVDLPVCMEEILSKNGIEGHPYLSTNTWDYEKYEDCHQWYSKRFKSTKKSGVLSFKGIDTISEVYLNGKLIGTTDNMFLQHDFIVDNLAEENELTVHILPAVSEGKKIPLPDYCFANKYNYESLNIRKCASSFGWDIFLRAPLGGIWKKVYLSEEECVFDKMRLNVDYDCENGYVSCHFDDVSRYKNIKIDLFSGESKYHFEKELEKENKFEVASPLPWNIRNHGKANLYTLVISLDDGDSSISKCFRVGFRNVKLKRSSFIHKGGTFQFIINGEPVYLLGTNWVPIDALKHIDKERMYKALHHVYDLNCNAIRVWGGGVYECDEFYSWCDEHGIFVWQDFMMGCAIYPRTREFEKKIYQEADSIVKKMSHHPSICLWAGDNECDVACQWAGDKINPNDNSITRNAIPKALKKNKQTIPYMPSSPYEDSLGYRHFNLLPEDHLWGPRDYFRGEYYAKSEPYFISETGYHGCPSPRTLSKFIKDTWPIFKEDGLPNKEYLAHATSVRDDYSSPYAFRIKLMSDQIKTLFEDDISNLHYFSLASQISQAEAMKYFIEKTRARKNTSGIIWWNLIDGWWQISDAIMDYDFTKKLAYEFIKRASNPQLATIFEEGEDLKIALVNSSEEEVLFKYEVVDKTHNVVIAKGSKKVKPHKVVHSFLCALTSDQTYYEVKYAIDDKEERLNHYVLNIKGASLNQYLSLVGPLYGYEGGRFKCIE